MKVTNQKLGQLRTAFVATSVAALSVASSSAQQAKPAETAAKAEPAKAAPAAQPAAQPSATEQWIQKSKNPVSWMKWGGDLRLRNEYLNNATTLNGDALRHEQDYFRIRPRVWTTIKPLENVDINARLGIESREWMKPSYHRAPITGWEWTAGVFDNLNIKMTNLFNQTVGLTIGRQDIMLGEPGMPWFICDGTPLDGSWTLFFDAARLTVGLKDYNTTIDAIYIDQGANYDRWLPTIRHIDRQFTEQNERGAVLYVSNTSIKNTTVDGYFIHKHDDRAFFEPTATYTGYDSDLYALGSRVSGVAYDHWKYYVEGAYQFGERSRNAAEPMLDIDAYGFVSQLAYVFKDRLKNQLRVQYEFNSGDDPGTAGENEQFDPLWGRYPRWSELYIYSFLPEGGRPSQISNVQRVGPGWSISPCSKADFSVNYYWLFSNENNMTTAQFSPTGNVRGQLLQTWLKYRFNPRVSGHFWAEFLWPGSYYTHKDAMTFLRAEVMLTY